MIATLENTANTTVQNVKRTGRRGYPEPMARAIVADYERLGCCQAVGKKWGRSRKTIQAFLKSKGFTFERKEAEHRYYKGLRYTLNKNGWVRSVKAGADEEPYLHRVVWKEHHGEIPEFRRIGFKDGNKSNVDIANLECVACSRHPTAFRNELTERDHLEMAEKMRPFIGKEARHFAQVFNQDPAELEHIGFMQAYRSAQYWQPGMAAFFGYSHRAIRLAISRHCQRFTHAVDVPLARFGAARCFSINAPLTEGSEETFESIYLGVDETVTREADGATNSELVDSLLQTLPERDRAILMGRFFDGFSLRDLAKEYHLSVERVRQIEVKCLSALRRHKAIRTLIQEES